MDRLIQPELAGGQSTADVHNLLKQIERLTSLLNSRVRSAGISANDLEKAGDDYWSGRYRVTAS